MDPSGARRRAQGQPSHAASSSHVENDRYMRDFERALEEMQVGPSSIPPRAGGMGRTTAPTRAPAGPARPPEAALQQQQQHPDAVPSSWRRGPLNPEGILCDLSDRPSLCAAANWERNEVVVVRTR